MTSTQNTFPLTHFHQQAEKIIFGKKQELQIALCCLLGKGHLLIEDLPGMGKTTFTMVLAQLLNLSFKRIQFTNDILPADILGIQILSEDRKSFHFHKGAIFSEVVLADELNRGTPKSQSALLQAMEEHAISIDGETYALPEPFFLIATQNPLEHAGTFPLPESQLDRFMMCMDLGFPDAGAEIEILKKGDQRNQIQNLVPVIKKQELPTILNTVELTIVSDTIYSYVQSILQISRNENTFKTGLSPRCGILLIRAAKSWAYLNNRNYVLPEDVKQIAPYLLRHRISGELDKNSHYNSIIKNFLEKIAVPL